MMRIFILLVSLCFITCKDKLALNPLSEIDLSWELKSNLERNGSRAVFTFFNRGDQVLSNANWTLYFNQANVMPSPNKNNLAEVSHINGDWFKLTPLSQFKINPGDSIQIEYFYEDALIKLSDAPMGLYFVSGEDLPDQQIIEPKQFKVKPFARDEQINRSESDFMPIPTSTNRYQENLNITILEKEKVSKIIPSPYSVKELSGELVFSNSISIAFDSEFTNEARYLKTALDTMYRGKIVLNENGSGEITLKKKSLSVNNIQNEAYRLNINKAGIEINANEAAGIFYGVQSLLALPKVSSFESGQNSIAFPLLMIEDAPRFSYRGFQLDVGRNFQTKETIKKVIDILSVYKINTFLFYLTEDEGWRLEIDGLPELTEVGAQRQHTKVQSAALHPSYGSGPYANKAGAYGSGYYTKEDFIEILKYARERHVSVIPEVNLPGHARAAIKSMEKRYERYMEQGNKEAAEEYRLIDPQDKSEYSSAQSYNDNIVCVCRESVYAFYEKVIDEIIDMYASAGVPLEYFHVGGDEVPKGPWTKSPLCDDLIAESPELQSADQLHPYFFRKAVEMLNERNIKIAGWEETALKSENGSIVVNDEFIDKNVIPYVWNNLWGNQDLGYKLANRGYPVVLCPVTNFYFDLAYDKDPEEAGLYWAGFVNTKNAYEYAPFDVFKTTKRDNAHYTPIDPLVEFSGMERLTANGRQNILGLQAQLWSETIKGPKMLEYYLLPKLFGFAESAWAKERYWETEDDPVKRNQMVNEGYNKLTNTIGQKEMPRLDKLFGGFNYRIPPPGAIITNGTLFANTSYPGLIIRYTTDGSEPDLNSPLYSSPVKVNSNQINLRAFNRAGRGGRISTVEKTNQLKQ